MSTDPAPAAGTDPAAGTGTGTGAQAAQAADPWTDPTAARAEIEKLRRESAGYRTKVRELEPLAAQATAAADAQKTETQRLTEQLATATAAATAAQTSALRFQVAAAKGLPPELAGRLQGATEAELTEDADKLVALIPGTQPGARPAVDLRQGARGAAPVAPQVDGNAWLRGLARDAARR